MNFKLKTPVDYCILYLGLELNGWTLDRIVYLVDELCHANHVALSIKDRQAEHGLGNKAVLIL